MKRSHLHDCLEVQSLQKRKVDSERVSATINISACDKGEIQRRHHKLGAFARPWRHFGRLLARQVVRGRGVNRAVESVLDGPTTNWGQIYARYVLHSCDYENYAAASEKQRIFFVNK